MTRHPTARRVHRQDGGADDAFVANILETAVWARENARKLIISAIVVAVVVLLAIFIISNRRAAFERATQELTPLRALVQSGQTEQAISQLEAYLQQHGGTRPAREARLLLAGQYLITNQPQKALDTVEPLGSDYADPLVFNAGNIRAAAYEALEETRRAEEVYLAMGQKAAFDYQRHDALDNAARLRLARNDAAGAIEIYQQLADATKESDPVWQVWQLRLGEARALAESGAPSDLAAPASEAAPAPADTAGSAAAAPAATTGQ